MPDLRPENDRNKNQVPDDVDKAIFWYLVALAVQTIVLIAGLYFIGDVLQRLLGR